MNRLLHLYFLVCSITGCQTNPAQKTDQQKTDLAPAYQPLVIKSGIENGHPAGIRIAIQTSKDTDTSTTYKLISSYEDRPIGFFLTVPREIYGKLKPSRSFIKSLGAPSDLFIQLLASRYNQKIDPAARMADSIPFICMSLGNLYDSGEAPKESDWIAAQYKLFFDSEKEEGDAELFMNIAPRQFVEFTEKDEDYRSHLIDIFKQKKNK